MIVLSISMVLDYIIGDPISWPHPVIYIGKLISKLEKLLIVKKQKKLMGFIMVFIVIGISYGIIELMSLAAGLNPIINYILLVYGLYAAIAYRSLIDASRLVYNELKLGDLSEARVKLSYIVGRDTKSLTKEQIIKATIETVAENSIDGVIAPLFYGVIGLILWDKPLHFIWLYKAINTMDSMVGYKNDKYLDFGYGAAKIDDLVNFIPARIGSILMLLASALKGKEYNMKNGIRIFLRDRKNHSSPNSAHPESVLAGLLNIQLGGNSHYFGKEIEKPTIGDDNRPIHLAHIRATENILSNTYMLLFVLASIYLGIGWFYGI